MARFVLETKATLMNEQENKFKDGEASITTLQVHALPSSVWKLIVLHHFPYLFYFEFSKGVKKKVKYHNWNKFIF